MIEGGRQWAHTSSSFSSMFSFYAFTYISDIACSWWVCLIILYLSSLLLVKAFYHLDWACSHHQGKSQVGDRWLSFVSLSPELRRNWPNKDIKYPPNSLQMTFFMFVKKRFLSVLHCQRRSYVHIAFFCVRNALAQCWGTWNLEKSTTLLSNWWPTSANGLLCSYCDNSALRKDARVQKCYQNCFLSPLLVTKVKFVPV